MPLVFNDRLLPSNNVYLWNNSHLPEDQPVFQNISAPGFEDVSSVNITQQHYFSSSQKEQELREELVFLNECPNL